MKQIATPKLSFEGAGSLKEIYPSNTCFRLLWHTLTRLYSVYCAKSSIKMSTLNKDQPIELPASLHHEIEVIEQDTVFINTADKRFKIWIYVLK